MKTKVVRIISALFAAVIASACLSACNTDPNVAQKDETSSTYEVVQSGAEQDEKEREGYNAYPSGKTDPIKLGDTEVKVTDFALRSYELAMMMGQTFKKPTDIPLDAAVQYAFLHVLYPDFYAIDNKSIQYKTATAEEIKAELKKQFGTDDFDITKSVLYNSSKKVFEMWTPEYGTNIYYTIDAVNIEGDHADIITTFYNELKRSTMMGRTTITVKVKDGKPVIAAVKSE